MGSRPITRLMRWGSYLRLLARALFVVLAAGLIGALLIRIAPGFGLDERALDPRLSAETLRAIQDQQSGFRDPVAYYFHFISSAARGDLGQSVVFGEPVRPLILERLPATVRIVAFGMFGGWAVAFLGAVAAALSRGAWPRYVAIACNGVFISVPVAVLAILCLLLRLPTSVAIGAVIAPRVWPHLYEQIKTISGMPHVVMARAKGIGGLRLLSIHIVPVALRPIVSLAGVSIPLAFGAAIPIEVLAEVHGLGELAWRAALGRDLPVLVSVTLLLTLVTVLSNLIPDLVLARPHRQSGTV